MKNYYKTLGISQNSSKEEIKKAFRELAFKYHPDKNTDYIFAEKFKEINEAKQVLLNDLKKFQYDEMLATFFTKKTVTGRTKDFKRKNIVTGNLHFQLIKETVINKFFLAVLFIVTVLSTIAFYKLPDEDLVIDPPLTTNSVSPTKKEPVGKPEIEVSYPPKKAIKKKRIPLQTEKKPFKHKTIIPAVYFSKKGAKKLPFNNEIKIAKPIHFSHLKAKKKPVITARFATAKIKIEQGQQKQLTNEKMIEILNQIKAEKQKMGNNSNCIQVIKSENSNISNVFMLANFLKSYGFIITGREKIPANISGININAMNKCITITVGTL